MPNAIVTIADQAHIEADIHGKRVHIRGTMRGTISAAARRNGGVARHPSEAEPVGHR